MTGRRYFNADLFGAEGVEVQTSKNMAQGIGFGITDINIDVSTSLQPIIEITFKDLYGNTMFGGNNPQSIDYSVFFAWPPPKFKFTFKGYLGRQVTYMLSLKKYDISFNSDDASYSIKGVFVPHQWGFFADLPFSFILAAKALKKEAGLISEDDDENVQLAEEYKSSVQDIIEVGAEVDITTNQVSNKFDNLIGRLNDLYANPPAFATSASAFEPLNGSVDGQQIENFVSIQLDQGQIEQVDREVYKKGGVTGLREYVLSKILFNGGENGGEKGQYFDNPLSDFSNDTIINNDKKKEIRDRVFSVIKANQDEIQKDISAQRFVATAGQLNKLTISRVLNQLASDSAYVMGRILEAGIKGFEEFGEVRKEAVEQDNLIARHYPLIINDEGQEVPAKNEFGTEESGNELDFVRIFTDAVIKGIVDFQNVAAINPDEVTSDVAHPISTLEIFAPKPYAGVDFTKFGTDILARSAIAAWFTKNSDITVTGDADAETIEALAEKDFQNITKTDLRRLSGTKGELGPREQLKRFCIFWERLINEEGTQFRLPNGGVDDEVFDLADYLKTNVTDFVAEPILNYRVVLDYGGKKQEVEQLRTQEELVEFVQDNPEVVIESVNDMLKDLFKGDLASIDPKTMAGDHFMNNGIPYFTGAHKKERDFDTFWIAFVGDDAIAANQILSNSEGAVLIETAVEADGEDLTDEAEEFNELVDDEVVFDYQKIRFKDSSRELNDNLTNFQTKGWTDSFASTQDYKDAFLMQRKIRTNSSDPGIDVEDTPILYVKAFTLNDNAYKNTGEAIDDGIIDVAADVLQSAADMAAWTNPNNAPLQVVADWAASVDFVEPNERVAFDLFTGDRNGFDN
ncbi:MAG: hypothetical protein P8J32_00625, partial [bacterium]|nr:hypothetical protein [bacterium]